MKYTLTPLLLSSTVLLLQQNCNAFTVLPSAYKVLSSVKVTSSPSCLNETPTPSVDVDADAGTDADSTVVLTNVITKTDIDTDTEKEEYNYHEIMKIPIIERMSNVQVTSVKTNEKVNLSTFLQSSSSSDSDSDSDSDSTSTSTSMLVFGTYAADFNAIEYVQRLRYYLPQLNKKGVTKVGLVLNCDAAAAIKLVNLLDLETDATTTSTPATRTTTSKSSMVEILNTMNSSDTDDSATTTTTTTSTTTNTPTTPTTSTASDMVVELFIDPKGDAGRAFGVGRGWIPDDDTTSPYLKLFGMLFGLGAWATLPAVIGGYIGNPFYGQPWIEDALAVGQSRGRWPDTALELDDDSTPCNIKVSVNKFQELPLVGSWERRPLELATLRLQNMIDVSIKNWGELGPKEDALEAGVLTQLGGCVVVNSKTGEEITRWRDPGICAVANFEDILKAL